MQTYYRDRGEEERAKDYVKEGADASNQLFVEVTLGGAAYGVGKLFRITKGLRGAKFAQGDNFSANFSKDGQRIYSELTGRTIKTPKDLTNAITDGVVSVDQIPVNYVIRDGDMVILNTRTSAALNDAGIPIEKWKGIDVTGKEVPGMPGTTFDDLANDQINNNLNRGALTTDPPTTKTKE